MKTTFIINNYDKDGDLVDEGIFINIVGEDIKNIIKFKNTDQLRILSEHLSSCAKEIDEYYHEYVK